MGSSRILYVYFCGNLVRGRDRKLSFPRAARALGEAASGVRHRPAGGVPERGRRAAVGVLLAGQLLSHQEERMYGVMP